MKKDYLENRLSIIWDMTKQCPWECVICCMSAENDSKCRNDEPGLEEKLAFVRSVAAYSRDVRPCRVDFSGGEVLTNFEENILVIEEAAKLLGRENVGLSTSGFGMTEERAQRLSNCISDCEMTMDTKPGTDYALRPKGYPLAAMRAVPMLKKHGIRVGIQTVLANSNTTRENLCDLYSTLCALGVDEWSFISFCPSGRGAAFSCEVISEIVQRGVVSLVKEMDSANKSDIKPKIDFHYSMPGHPKYYNGVCRCVKKSIGILADGTVTSCFWAVDGNGMPIEKFVLGNIRSSGLSQIMNSENAMFWANGSHNCELLNRAA